MRVHKIIALSFVKFCGRSEDWNSPIFCFGLQVMVGGVSILCVEYSRLESEPGMLEGLYSGEPTRVIYVVSLGVPVVSSVFVFLDRFFVVEVSNFVVVWCVHSWSCS